MFIVFSVALPTSKQQPEVEDMEVDADKPGPSNSETLPEGFFDDPKLDAKVLQYIKKNT
jgi:hypothetical protein